MLRLYDSLISGNAYKVRLLMSRLGLGGERVDVDILSGGAQTHDFRERNPVGQVPVLEVEPGVFLAESNAILCYLAEGTTLLPADKLLRAKVFQWLFFEQNQHEPGLATSRFLLRFVEATPERQFALAAAGSRGERALAVLEGHLQAHQFLVGRSCTIADIALYAYTHVAGEGGFDLDKYPAIRAWLARIEAQPGHIEMSQPYP